MKRIMKKMTQISSSLVFFFGTAFKLGKVGPAFSTSIYVHPWQQTTETTSMPKKALSNKTRPLPL